MTALALPSPTASPYAVSIRRYRMVGLALIAAFAVSLVVWSSTAPLSSAVIAGGRIEVDGSVKRVQHETGGIIAQLLVTEGQRVREGEVIARLDATTARAALDIITGKLDELWMSAARLKAERDGQAAMDLPAFFAGREHDPAVITLLATEQRLFMVRLAARSGQKDQLGARIGQLESQIAGLTTQQVAKAREIALTATELSGSRSLLAKGVVSQSRVNELDRDYARLEGEQGQIVAQIAELGGRIAETRLQMLSIDQAAIADAGRDLNEATSAIAELSQRRLAATEQLARLEIKAPIDGVIYQLAVHTVGGVVGSGQIIATVVPTSGVLNVEAWVSPGDIDAVRVGQEATIRLPGLNHSTTTELKATVRVVAADLTEDPATRLAYYPVTLDLAADEIEKLDGVALVPGMPVEAFISDAPRTFLDYLIQPIGDRMSHALREK